MHIARAAPAGILVAALLILSGCAPNSKMAEVKGKVTLDDLPVENGGITFIPLDGKSPTGGGLIQKGEYSGKAPIGGNRVEIHWSKPTGKMKALYNTEQKLERPETTEAIPAKYNVKSELTLEVKPGKNEKDWELKSK
jgi:hypothetical protein